MIHINLNILCTFYKNDFYFIWEFLCFSLMEKALFQEILGLLLVYADWEKGDVCLRVFVHAFHDLELLRYVLHCAIDRQLWFPAGMNKVYCYCYTCRAQSYQNNLLKVLYGKSNINTHNDILYTCRAQSYQNNLLKVLYGKPNTHRMIWYTHVEHGPTKTIYLKYSMENQSYTHSAMNSNM